MQYKIEVASIDDYAALCALWKSLDEYHADVVPDRIQHYDGSIRSEAFVNGFMKGDDRIVFLIFADGEPVGFTNLWIVEVNELELVIPRKYVQMGNIFIQEQHRGKGLAGKLVERSVEWCKKKGIDKMELQVYGKNDSAIGMYQHLGFSSFIQRMELDF